MIPEHDQKEAVETQKKRRGIALDSVFPSVLIVLVFVAAMLFFQVLMGWKIINLEREKQTLLDDRQRFREYTENFPDLQAKIKKMEVERDSLNADIIHNERNMRQLRDRTAELQDQETELSKKLRKMDVLFLGKRTGVKEAEKSLTDLKRRHRNIEADFERLSTEEVDLREANDRRKREVLDLKNSIKRLTEEEDELRMQISKQEGIKSVNLQMVEVVRQLKRAIGEFEKRTSAASEAFKVVNSDIEEMQVSIKKRDKEFGSHMEDLREQLDAFGDKSQQLSSEIVSFANNIDDEKKKLSAEVESIKALRVQGEYFVNNISELSAVTKNIDDEKKKLFAEVESIKALGVQLGQLNRDYQSALQTMGEYKLKAAKNT